MMPEDPYAYVEVTLQAPPLLDYVPGPEEPEHAPPLPDLVPEPVYPEFMPSEDDVLPIEEQPLPVVVSLTADLPGYITKSDPEEDPEEDDEDLKEDPADYPDNRDDEEEEESFGDDANNEEKGEDEDEDEEVEHPALANSISFHIYSATISTYIILNITTTYTISTTTSIITLPVSPSPLPTSPTYPLGYRAAMIRLRAELPSTSHPLPLPSPIVLLHTRAFMAMMRAAAPSTYILASRSETLPSGTPPLLSIPLPTPSIHLLLPSTDCRAGVFE
ncbi:hypothetical protein Tco_1334449, partial [Tanacetum coccineum]